MAKLKRWDEIIKRAPRNAHIAEIGVWEGDTSARVLKYRPDIKLIQVDRWEEYTETEAAGEPQTRMVHYDKTIFEKAEQLNIKRIARYRDRVQVIREWSVKAAEQVQDNSLDLVFIDAGHSYGACLSDILTWLPKVRRGGIIGGHDYPRRPGVKRAVDELFSKIDRGHDATWWTKKP